MSEIRGEQSIEESKPEEQKSEYNFELMKEIEPAMVSLVAQLKDKIETGEYSALLSDDVGGRIPTLVLRKILEEKSPNPNIKTHFLASGATYTPDKKTRPEDFEKLKNYLRGLDFGDKKVLIVTQFIRTGETLGKTVKALENIGVTNLDFAALRVHPSFNGPELLRHQYDGDVFFGGEEFHHFSEGHQELSGFAKRKDYSPRPETLVGNIRREGRGKLFTDKEFQEIFGITENDSRELRHKKLKDLEKIREYKRKEKEPLTLEEAKEIQRMARLAREDVKIMAKRVVEQVWK